MKRINKMLLVIVSVILIMLVLVTPIFAKYTPEQFEGKINTTASGTDDVKETGGKIVGIIRVVGTIVSVGMLIVLGIKYMMGSAEERAEYKKTLFPYLVGAVLIFGASNLTQVIYTWASEL